MPLHPLRCLPLSLLLAALPACTSTTGEDVVVCGDDVAAPLASAFITSTETFEQHPTIAAHARTGGFLAAWAVQLEGSSFIQPAVQLLGPDLQPRGDVRFVGAPGVLPALAEDPERDEFLLVWSGGQGMRIDSDGAPLSEVITLIEAAAVDTTKVAWKPGVGFVVAATDDAGRLYTRVVRDGAVLDAQTLVVTIPGFISLSSLVASDPGFLVGLTVSGGAAIDVDVGFVALDDVGASAPGTEPHILHKALAQSGPSGAFDISSKTTLFVLIESTATDGRRLVGVRVNPDATQVADTFVLDDEDACGVGTRDAFPSVIATSGERPFQVVWESQTELSGFVRTMEVGRDGDVSPTRTIAGPLFSSGQMLPTITAHAGSGASAVSLSARSASGSDFGDVLVLLQEP